MVVTKNRAGAGVVLAVMVFITACAPSGPRALVAGKRLLDAGKTDAAIQELKVATSLLPTNAVAWNYLGLAYHRAGQWTNAVDAYSRALRHNRDLVEVRYNLGCLWLDLNQPEAAKTEFLAFTYKRDNVTDGWLKLGAAQLRTSKSDDAEKSFREALRVNNQSAEALNGLGLVQLQRKRPREAADQFATALKRQPNYRPALLNLATVSHQYLNDRATALRRYREYLALQPRPSDWEAVQGIVASLEQPVVASPRAVTNPVAPVRVAVIATNPPKPVAVAANREPVTPRPELVVSTGKTATASSRTIAPALASAPPTAAASVEVVRLPPEPVIRTLPAESNVVSPTGARIVAAKSPAVATNTPAAKDAKVERRGLLAKLNPFKRETGPQPEAPVATSSNLVSTRATSAGSATSRYSYLSPTPSKSGDRPQAQAALTQGQQAQRAGRLAEAIQSYRRATQLDGSYFEAQYCLGLAAFEARSFRVALAAWEHAIAIRPDSADARYNFALTLKAEGYPQDAADELEKLLALHPDEARGHLTLGNLYAEQLRDVPRARRHYARVLQLDPRNPQAQSIRYWLVANPG